MRAIMVWVQWTHISIRTARNQSERNYRNWEGGFDHCFQISSIFVRSEIRISHWPKAPRDFIRPQNRNSDLAAAWMQRWALLLSGYQNDIEYRSPNKHANADCLSRLLLSDHVRNENDEIQQINRVLLESLPVSAAHVRKETRVDPILARMLE